MESVKLSITCRTPLAEKYNAKGLARIDAAIGKWIKADAKRGIRTHHVAVDDAAAMKPYKVPPVKGEITAAKVKEALDALVARLSPDYIVLIGAGDVVPLFEVSNPTLNDGDTDAVVPTDNPYASSVKFGKKRATYLVPDRVVGRIPDLPGSSDPSWLIGYLAVATSWRSRAPSKFKHDLMVCCYTWRKSGQACVKFLERDTAGLLLSPPALDRSKKLKDRHQALLQMIKCHGAEKASRFFGQKGHAYPEVLRSTSLNKRTRKATVVGSMCCFGASLFDPLDPAALFPNEPPIASVYLRQGGFGFLGSTSTAWVGLDAMLCADWIVAAFLKAVLNGASLGRAALEAKQDLIRWNQQQGDQIDSAEEKTLLQFVLLGDPSIHPITAAPATTTTASLRGAAPTTAALMARRQRRATRHQLGSMLRRGLPMRHALQHAPLPKELRAVASELAKRAGDGFRFKLSAPRVQRVVSDIEQPELSMTAAGPLATAGLRSIASHSVSQRTLQYSWVARRQRGPVPEIRLVNVQTDPKGAVLRTQVLASS